MLKKPDTLSEHHITVQKSARFYTIGTTGMNIRRVWIVCHGYSQLAGQFIRYFGVLDDGANYVVAPEGLNLFYLNRFAAERDTARKVGATWMTREDRLTAIDDYISFLSNVHDRIFDDLRRKDVELYVLGFSQGCATVARWLTTTDYDVDRLILWGGILPPDLDAKTAQPRLRNAQLTLVIGKTDEYVSEPALKAEEGRLGQWGVPYELVRFDGGHHLSQTVLGELADRTERTA